MTDRNMKNILLLTQTIREMQIIFMMRYHLRLFRRAAISVGEDVEKRNSCPLLVGM